MEKIELGRNWVMRLLAGAWVGDIHGTNLGTQDSGCRVRAPTVRVQPDQSRPGSSWTSEADPSLGSGSEPHEQKKLQRSCGRKPCVVVTQPLNRQDQAPWVLAGRKLPSCLGGPTEPNHVQLHRRGSSAVRDGRRLQVRVSAGPRNGMD